MALTSKQPSMRASTLGSRLPDLPHPPPTLIEQPGFTEYDREQRRWWDNVRTAVGDIGVDRDKQYSSLAKSVTVGDATLSAAITTEASVRAGADSAEAATRLSVDATLQTNIDTVSASVTTEATARATADGFLSGKYTLTVTAGDVVTGMNITSSSGSGTDISDVTFVAANFKIYNGVTGKVMFNVSGTDVLLANTLTVSTSGKVYIGTGTYNDSSTAFYVDSAGQFSLKDKLSWNGTTLTVNGTVTAGAGAIGGFNLGSDYIRDAADSFGLASTVTGGDDVRFWAGATFANRATAPFRLTEAGALVATSATLTGTITSTSGTIGGFTIGTTTFTAGSGDYCVEITSDVATKGFGIQLGVTGTGHFWSTLDRVGIIGRYVPSSDKGGFMLRSYDATSLTNEGRLDLFSSAGSVNVLLRATDGTGVFSGTVSVGTGGYKVSGTKVVGAQASAEADFALNSTLTGAATVDLTSLQSNFDDLNTKLNSLLGKLRTHGLIAS